MLPRDSLTRGLGILLPLALTQCTGAGGGGPTATLSEAILGGQVIDTPDPPVLYLVAPGGSCTAVLIAPNLAATARHCVAELSPGTFACTPEGNLEAPGDPAGEIGQNYSPSEIAFFTNAQVMSKVIFVDGATPQATGVQILSTNTPTACADDLAFVVLSQAIAGAAPVPVRLTAGTLVGEAVSVWGYGLTADASDPTALRVNAGAEIVGVGPDEPTDTEELAPLRAVRIGPGNLTCNGDSGGPILSNATGALIAVDSLGAVAGTTGLSCADGMTSDSTGPRLAAYTDLALAAFAAAGATPILEGAPPADASAGDAQPGDAQPEERGANDQEGDLATVGPQLYDRVTGGSCATSAPRRGASGEGGAFLLGLAIATAAVGRRRRRPE